jgi:carbonic anhydrase
VITRRQFTLTSALVLAGGWRVAVHAADPAPAVKHPSAAEVWAKLVAGNKRFTGGKPQARALGSLRQQLAKGQHPPAIVLGCADSRVSPSLVFDQTVGELFEVRTAGNIADDIALGSIEYAQAHFLSPVLLVLGHEKCGAVAATLEGGQAPSRGVEAIVKKISPAAEKVKGKAQGDALLALAVEANVHQSAQDLLEGSPGLRKAVDGGQLTVIKAVYKLASGEVVRLT